MKNVQQSKLKPRRQRRIDAKEAGHLFQPQYSEGVRIGVFGREIKVGGAPRTYEAVYGRKIGVVKPTKTKEATQ